MKNIELLAPAGSLESLNAAINAGADAIYIGGSAFGARKSAGFSNEELREAVEICHKNGVLIYVTVNTLIKENELSDCMAFVDFLYHANVDALILQDFGLVKAIKKYYPDLDCHASTQMTLHSTEDVLFAAECGFTRVVVARELSFEEIKAIRKETDIELEVFVHGALCISYSGNCLMSSMIGGRSGNRGSCAQPCRKKYTLKQQDTGEIMSQKGQVYLLSPKDLSVIEHIEAFKQVHNISLKIEGRLKGPDYVYNVVSHYRNAIDGRLNTIEDLRKSFNRQFTDGHLFEAKFDELMNYEIPSAYGTILGKVKSYDNQFAELVLFDTLNKGDEIQYRYNGTTSGARAEVIIKGNEKVEFADKGDVVKVNYKYPLKKNAILYKTYDKRFIDEMVRNGKMQYPKYGVKFDFVAKLDNPACLKATLVNLDHDELMSAIEPVQIDALKAVEKARSMPLDSNRIYEQLSKLGGTSFYLDTLDVEIDDDIALPISELNRMRRQAIGMIEKQMLNKYPNRIAKELKEDVPEAFKLSMQERIKNHDPVKLANATKKIYRIHVYDKLQLEQVRSFRYKNEGHLTVEILYHDLKHYMSIFKECMDENIIPALPKIVRNDELDFIKTFIRLYFSQDESMRQISISHLPHLGMIRLYQNASVIIEEDAMLFNSLAIKSFEIQDFALTHEVTFDESKVIFKHINEALYNLQWYVYGRFPVMTSEYCVVGGVLDGHDHCGRCSKASYMLEDEMHEAYPLYLEPSICRMHLLLPRPVYLVDEMDTMLKNGIRIFKISFLGASDLEIEQILKQLAQNNYKFDRDLYSRGHFKKEIE